MPTKLYGETHAIYDRALTVTENTARIRESLRVVREHRERGDVVLSQGCDSTPVRMVWAIMWEEA